MASSLQWKQLIGQERIKEVLSSAFVNKTLGHAYIFCGDAGTGKFAAAFELGMALLCKSSDNKPCFTCDSCSRMLKYGHPDFHVIMPVALEKEHRSSESKLTDEGWKFIGESVLERIKNPYNLRTFSAIPSIPLDWVKEVSHAITRGALEGERNVAILDGVDYMSKESANAMLKTLEEPPAGTVMLLIAERVHAVLPTIISRCQILRFSYLSPELISDQLSKRYNLTSDDQRIQDVAYTGSLGQSIYLFDNPQESISKDAAEFWTLCLRQDWIQLSEMIDRLGRLDDFGIYEKFFIETMHLIRNAFFNKLRGTENYIMGNRSLEIDLGIMIAPEKIEDLIGICEDAVRQISARANISLVLVNFAISLMEIFNGEKQQVG
jgi:DNA polymerase III subunit delta'